MPTAFLSSTAVSSISIVFCLCDEVGAELAKAIMCVCVCVFVVIPFILDDRLVDVPAGVTQKKGHTRFLHLPSATFALIFSARRIQPFLSLVDREVEFCLLMN